MSDRGWSVLLVIGQVLANRPDIVREDYMNELCTLQDDVPAFPSEVSLNPLLQNQDSCPL